MKWLRLFVVGGLIGLGAATFVKLSSASPRLCTAAYRHDTTITVGNNTIDAEIPENAQKKDIGLSGRACIGADQGMLFVFDKPDQYNFWMKDMKFPIDIVWLDDKKNTIGVTPSLSPSTYPQTFTSKSPAKYVLEIQSGRAQQLNVVEGTQLQFNL
jgi:uncharacterized membrane protein (UPF0127 family)